MRVAKELWASAAGPGPGAGLGGPMGGARATGESEPGWRGLAGRKSEGAAPGLELKREILIQALRGAGIDRGAQPVAARAEPVAERAEPVSE